MAPAPAVTAAVPQAAEPPARQPQAVAATADFPAIPGIDVGDGLRRMMNKAALYEKVLRDFHTRFSGEPERIRQALAAGDRDSATRMAHSVKGTGGTIGARDLFAHAKNSKNRSRGATGPGRAALGLRKRTGNRPQRHRSRLPATPLGAPRRP
jgi:hypothetical protein